MLQTPPLPMAATARDPRSDRGIAAKHKASSRITGARLASDNQQAGRESRPAEGGRHVGSFADPVYRPVVGSVLQFHGAFTVRLSLLLLVPVRLGADHLV